MRSLWPIEITCRCIKMILNDHQLPDPNLMKHIYYELVKQTHPEVGNNQETSQLNLAYETAKE